MARIRTDYKPWLKVEYRGKQIDLPHDVGYVVVNKLGEVVGYEAKPRLNGDSWDASGFAYILATNVDATRWWESLTTSGYLMEAAAGVKPRDGKTEYRNYWYAGGPICVPTWAQWVAEDKHGNIVAIEGAMRPNVSMYGKWAPKRNQLHVRRDRSGNGWRHSLINIDHLPTMEQHLPKGFKDELRPLVYQLTELMVPSWVNFITTDPNGDIHGHHTRPSVWCNSQWMSNTGSIPMCYLGYTPNRGNWKDTLLFLEQKESEQKVEKEQKPKWGTQSDVELVKAWINGATIEQLADAYDVTLDYVHNKLQQFGLLSPNKNGFVTAHVSNDVDETYDIEHILGVQLDGTCGGAYYLPKTEDSVDLAVLVGFAHGLSIRAISDGVGVPAHVVLEVFARQFDGMSNFLNRLRFGNWDTLGPVTIAEYKRDANDPVAAEVTVLFYQGEFLSFEPDHKWVATDADGGVHAFTEKPSRCEESGSRGYWLRESGERDLLSHDGARNNWGNSLTRVSNLTSNAPDDYKSVHYMKLRYWVPSWVKFISADAHGWLVGHKRKPKEHKCCWQGGGQQFNMGPSVGVLIWQSSLYDVEHDLYIGRIAPDWLADEAQRPTSVGVDVAPAESFTMVTFKLPSKTVATQEAMLTDEMFLAGVAFGMRLNKLLSKQGDSDVKEGN